MDVHSLLQIIKGLARGYEAICGQTNQKFSFCEFDAVCPPGMDATDGNRFAGRLCGFSATN